MSKTKKIIAVCLVIAVIGLIIQIVDAIMNRGTLFTPGIITTAIIPIILGLNILSLKGNDKE